MEFAHGRRKFIILFVQLAECKRITNNTKIVCFSLIAEYSGYIDYFINTLMDNFLPSHLYKNITKQQNVEKNMDFIDKRLELIISCHCLRFHDILNSFRQGFH